MENSNFIEKIKKNLDRINHQTSKEMTSKRKSTEKFDSEFNQHFTQFIDSSLKFGREAAKNLNDFNLKADKEMRKLKMDKWKLLWKYGSDFRAKEMEIGYLTYSISPKKGGKRVNIYFEYSDKINEILRFYYSHTFQYNGEDFIVNNYNMPLTLRKLEKAVFELDAYINDWIQYQFSTKLSKHIGMEKSKIEFKLFSQFRSLHNKLIRDEIIQSGMRFKNFKENFKRGFLSKPNTEETDYSSLAKAFGSNIFEEYDLQIKNNQLNERIYSLSYETICELIQHKQPFTPINQLSIFEIQELEKLDFTTY